MAESITFRGCFIRYFDVRMGKEGGDVFCRLHMSAEFSDTAAEKMGWEDPGESVTSASNRNGARTTAPNSTGNRPPPTPMLPSKLSPAKLKPRNVLPTSPMNRRAGGKL